MPSHAGTPTTIPRAMYEWQRPTGSYYPYYTSGYPTAAGYYSYPYGSYGTYPAQATAHPGTGAASLGHSPDPDQMTPRAASYFFGFLITFIVVLLIFVACGIGRRRRIAARRSRRREVEDGPHIVRFGGLLASGHPRRGATRLTNEEILKKKPTYHEVWLNLGNEKHPNRVSDSEGGLDEEGCKNAAHTVVRQNTGWGVIEPLAASLTRTPKDLQPYQHFHEAVTTANSAHLRNGSQDEMPPPYDTGEGDGAWYHRLPPAWTPFGIGIGSRNSRRGRTPPTISPISNGQHQPIASNDIEMNIVNEKASTQEIETRRDGNVEIAVVVMMPNERSSINRRIGQEVDGASFGGIGMQNTLPEYQIGVTHARMGADNGRQTP